MATTTMHSLPVELLAEIFTHCLPKNATPTATSNSPLLLMRVCRLWRDITVATPVLWTTFSIDLTSAKGMIPSESLELWLSRSQNMPLTINVDDAGCEEPRADPQYWMVYEELCRHAQRWQSVTFNIPFAAIWCLPTQQPLKLLKGLKFGSEEEDQPVPGQALESFATAPQLRAVDITLDASGAVYIQGIHLPWHQLTTFRGTLFATYECAFVLREATNLVDCRFSDVSTGMVSDSPPKPHFQLCELQMDARNLITCLDLLPFFSFPNLKRLALGSLVREGRSQISWSVFNSLLSRSSCSLVRLDISVNNIKWTDSLVECFSLLPSLEHMEIFWFNEESSITPLLQTSNALLPRLHTLVLYSENSPSSPWINDIVSLLFVRTSDKWVTAHGASLQHFHYIWMRLGDPYPDETVQSRIKALRDRGLHVEFRPNEPFV
ncbi:hypothetical protein MIND_01002400 [Mycena indigotica]|uniref:F-box domain-containing protein n=1 Tax=Mycena indigotica TaxID=2126181 RepID=A0A8H6S9L1_9AGAR|nr:uncharacterized protein MIND_01002400 [Mycena indigotica]KAF7294656.1 hypothetical protein MIND_01002400 [Mycena indigotica]